MSERQGLWILVFAVVGGLVNQIAGSTTSLAAAVSTYQSTVLADAPAAYWSLGEAAGATSVADASGHNHPANVIGNVMLGTPGALINNASTAATFDGSSSYLRDTSALVVGANFTIETWIKPKYGGMSGSIVSLFGSGLSRTLYLNGGQLVGMADLSSAWPSFAVFGPTIDTSWHHVVFTTQNGSQLRLYVDGAPAGSATVASRPGFSAAPVIGWTDATWMPKFAGSIDDVALYRTTLSAARITAHYAVARGAVVPASNAGCGSGLQALIDAAPDGATVNVPPCVYRETVTIDKSLTLAGQPGSEIRGSDVWTAWTANGSAWLSRDAVPNLPVVSQDPNACEPNTGNRCLWPEQMFIDGRPLYQVAAGTIPAADQFALVSSTDRRLRLGNNPSGHQVEVSTRPRWIITGADRVTVQGLTMRHAGNSTLAGAISNDGYSSWTLQDSTVSDAHSANVSLDGGANVHVLRNDIGNAGLAGVAGTGISQGGVVQGNRLHGNRTGNAAFKRSWGAGGLKLTQVQAFLVDANEVDHNDAAGLWCDIGCSNVTFSNNRVHHNQWQGINFEISNGASIHDNVLWENGWGFQAWGWGAGIVTSSSANAEVFDNTVAWNYAGISVIWQNRPGSPGPNPVGNYVHDNTIVKTTVTGNFAATYWQNLSLAFLSDGTAPLYDPVSNNRGSNNAYWYDQPEAQTERFSWSAQYFTLAEFLSTAGGSGGRYLSTAEMNQILSSKSVPLAPDFP